MFFPAQSYLHQAHNQHTTTNSYWNRIQNPHNPLKMSAIAEGNEDGPAPIIQVLFALHSKFGAQELCGPLEVLSKALQKTNDPSMLEPSHRAF